MRAASDEAARFRFPPLLSYACCRVGLVGWQLRDGHGSSLADGRRIGKAGEHGRIVLGDVQEYARWTCWGAASLLPVLNRVDANANESGKGELRHTKGLAHMPDIVTVADETP